MKFIFTGAESTFKTELSLRLHEQTGWKYVPEYARTYLEQLSEPLNMLDFPQEHFLKIAAGQLHLESTQPTDENIIFDTDRLTLNVWGSDKFGTTSAQWLPQKDDAIYFLCAPTNAGTADPLRADLHRREELHQRYKALLEEHHCNYHELTAPLLADRYVELVQKLQSLNYAVE